MYQVTSNLATPSHDGNYNTATKAATFIMSSDTLAVRLEKLRKAQLFFRQIAKADDLLEMSVLLYKRDDRTTVLVKSPLNIWVDITNSTPEEVELVSIGAINPLQPDPIVDFLGALAGLDLVDHQPYRAH